MNDDSAMPPEATVYSYDCRSQLSAVRGWSGPAPTAEELTALVLRERPTFAFEHDARKGTFRLTWADGRVEEFRDKPVRHLSVEPDESGALKPVIRRGGPVYLYLCREEREER